VKRVNIGLKDETHKDAKIIAILKDVRLNKYLEEAIEKAVKEDSNLIKKIRGDKNK